MKVVFRLPGPLVGYSKKRYESHAYRMFKQSVYAYALEVGLPPHFQPTIKDPAILSVSIFWKRRPRIDWKNVVGGIEDALFPQDRYVVPGEFSVSWMTSTDEHAVVAVEIGLTSTLTCRK